MPSNELCCHRASRGLSLTSVLSMSSSANDPVAASTHQRSLEHMYKASVSMVMERCSGPKQAQQLFQHFYPRHLSSSHPVSTAKQSESMMRDNCMYVVVNVARNRCLCFLCAKSPTGPFQYFCPALVSPLRSVSNSELAKGIKRHILKVFVEKLLSAWSV